MVRTPDFRLASPSPGVATQFCLWTRTDLTSGRSPNLRNSRKMGVQKMVNLVPFDGKSCRRLKIFLGQVRNPVRCKPDIGGVEALGALTLHAG